MSADLIEQQNKEFSSKQWFGARKLNDNQIIKSADLEDILGKAKKATKKHTDAYYERLTSIANDVLKKIGKLTKSKIRTVSKQRKNGYLFVTFTTDIVLDFPTTKQRNGITITKLGSREYHLFVGDMNVDT